MDRLIGILDAVGLLLIAIGAYLWVPAVGYVTAGAGLLLLSFKLETTWPRR